MTHGHAAFALALGLVVPVLAVRSIRENGLFHPTTAVLLSLLELAETIFGLFLITKPRHRLYAL